MFNGAVFKKNNLTLDLFTHKTSWTEFVFTTKFKETFFNLKTQAGCLTKVESFAFVAWRNLSSHHIEILIWAPTASLHM